MLRNKGGRGQRNHEEIGAGATVFIFLAAAPLVRPARQNRHATQAISPRAKQTVRNNGVSVKRCLTVHEFHIFELRDKERNLCRCEKKA